MIHLPLILPNTRITARATFSASTKHSPKRQVCEQYATRLLLKAEGMGRDLTTRPIVLAIKDFASRAFQTDRPSQKECWVAANTLAAYKKAGIRPTTKGGGKRSPEGQTCWRYIERLLIMAEASGRDLKTHPIVLSQRDLARRALQTETPSFKQLRVATNALVACKRIGNGVRPMRREEQSRQQANERRSPDSKTCWRYIERLLIMAEATERDLKTHPIVLSQGDLARRAFQTKTPSPKQRWAAGHILRLCKRRCNGIRPQISSESVFNQNLLARNTLQFVDDHLCNVYLARGVTLPTSYSDLAKTLFGPQPSKQQLKATKRALRNAYESVNGQNEKPVNRKWLNTTPSPGSIIIGQEPATANSPVELASQNEVRDRVAETIQKLGNSAPLLSKRLSDYLKTGDPEALASLSDADRRLFISHWRITAV